MFYSLATPVMKNLMSILFLLFSVVLSAQEEDNYTENTFQGTRLVNEQSANLTEKGKLLLFIQHRFGEIDGGLYQLFGLDQATLRLGFEYGFGQNLNLGFGRSTYMKTYDVYGKYRFVQQGNSFPLTLVATAAGSVPTIRNVFPDQHNSFSDKLSGNVQSLTMHQKMNCPALATVRFSVLQALFWKDRQPVI